MDCTECQGIVHACHGDELEEQLLAEAEAHLSGCCDCRKEAADLLASLDRLRVAFPDQMPPEALWEKTRGCTAQSETSEE